MKSTEFQINDMVSYGGSGVCVVEDIGTPAISGIDKSRKYYTLKPIYTNGCTVVSPVDNAVTVMRRLITRKEAEALIELIPDLETIWVDNEKEREEIYRRMLHTYTCLGWARIVKTLRIRIRARLQQKKSLRETDKRYLRAAEDLLFGELSVALDIPKDSVESYIDEHLPHEQGQTGITDVLQFSK